MRRETFERRRADFIRRDSRSVRLQIVGFVCGLAVLYGVAYFIPEANDLVVVAMLVLAVPLLVWLYRVPNHAKNEGLVCRACGGGLLNALGDHALATGRCPHCGDAAFDD